MCWKQIVLENNRHEKTPIWKANYSCCSEDSYWSCITEWTNPRYAPIESGTMISPKLTTAPMAHIDMPESIMGEYEEARVISFVTQKESSLLNHGQRVFSRVVAK